MNVDMVRAKTCVFIEAQGLDRENLEPLVKIIGEPRMHIDRVKIGMAQTDMAARGIFENWSATFTVRWDNDVFSAVDVINLLARRLAGWYRRWAAALEDERWYRKPSTAEPSGV